MDHPVLNGSIENIGDFGTLQETLQTLKELAVNENVKWADRLGINPAAAVSCVKPSGTVSQLADAASGIHPRYSPYYIRTVRADAKDPLAKFLIDKGVYYEPDVTKPETTVVFSFPIKSPEGSVFRNDRTAIEQLELWKTYQLYWCEHKPSITVYVKEDEWLEVGSWVYKNFSILSGVSFLPYSNHNYRQAPYQEISKAEYDKWVEKYKSINLDWNELAEYESEDYTISSQELACVSGVCEI